MNTLIIHFSKFGNTQMVAEAIAAALPARDNIRVIAIDSLAVLDLKSADLVVMGTPTHNMNLPKAVQPLLKALPKNALKEIFFATFDTSYKMSWWLNHFTAAKRLARTLRKLGGKRVVPPETFHVTAREGPLYEGELERAKAWARLVRSQLAPEPGRYILAR